MPVTIRKDVFGSTKDGRTVHSVNAQTSVRHSNISLTPVNLKEYAEIDTRSSGTGYWGASDWPVYTSAFDHRQFLEEKHSNIYKFEGSVAKVTVLDYGCAIQSIEVPDKDGKMADVCLGYDTVEGYEANIPYIGVVVGRVAGRVTNAKFTVDGQSYQLDRNYGDHSIHGGHTGFGRRIWDASIAGSSLTLTYISPDGEEQFPGEMTTTVTYTLSPEGVLTLDYSATCTKACPINLTHHGYYNLAGHEVDNVLDHVVQIKSNRFVDVDPNNSLVPTGKVLPVAGSRIDFNSSTSLSDKEDAVRKGDCDVTYGLENGGRLKHVSRIYHPGTGRYVDTSTTTNGLQFYTAMFMKDVTGKGGKEYQPFNSFCLETQNFPDAANHTDFPDTILRPGQTYKQLTQFVFGVM